MIVILHNIRSLYNVGSIFRTADAAGVEKLYLAGITPVPFDRFGKIRPQFAKVSLGAEKYVEWDASARSARAVTRLLERLKSQGYKILAIEQNPKAVPYYRFKLRGAMTRHSRAKLALVLGSEVGGLPQSVLRQCDKILEIPMRRMLTGDARHPRYTRQGKEPLNVSVSFAIVAFHLISR